MPNQRRPSGKLHILCYLLGVGREPPLTKRCGGFNFKPVCFVPPSRLLFSKLPFPSPWLKLDRRLVAAARFAWVIIVFQRETQTTNRFCLFLFGFHLTCCFLWVTDWKKRNKWHFCRFFFYLVALTSCVCMHWRNHYWQFYDATHGALLELVRCCLIFRWEWARLDPTDSSRKCLCSLINSFVLVCENGN